MPRAGPPTGRVDGLIRYPEVIAQRDNAAVANTDCRQEKYPMPVAIVPPANNRIKSSHIASSPRVAGRRQFYDRR